VLIILSSVIDPHSGCPIFAHSWDNLLPQPFKKKGLAGEVKEGADHREWDNTSYT
jgi:hypothetical protein